MAPLGFGSNNNATATSSPFGATKPAFGSAAPASGGGLFGAQNNASTPASTGFGSGGGFGNTANTGTGFGSSTTSGNNLFGANKPAATGFGGSTNGLFGGANTSNTGTTGGFGSGTTGTTGFGGATSTPAFGGAATQQPTNQGTAVTPFSAFIEKDNTANANSHYQSITFMQPYQAFSFEELRLADYNAGRKYGNSNGQAGAFGQSTGFGGGFGANTSSAPTTGFGAAANTNTGGGLFGAQNNTASTGFGASNNNNATSGFGSGGGLFGQQNKPAAGGIFGSTPASSGTTGSSLFGTANNNTTTTNTGFGGFGAANTQQNQGGAGGLFGNNANTTQNKPAFGGFGASTTGGSTGFGAGASTGFGQAANTNTTGGTGLFGQNASNNASPFGGAQNNTTTNNAPSGGLFGGFGQNNQNQPQQQNQTNATGGLFGGGFGQNNQQKPNPFGGSATGSTGGGLFGQNQTQQNNTGGTGLFGQNNNNNNNQAQSGGLFGQKPAAPGGNLFGAPQAQQNTGTGLFGGAQTQQNAGTGGLFGQANQQKPAGSLFGNNNNNNAQPAAGGSLFGGLGGSQNQQQNAGTGSLFGNSAQQQNQAVGGLFGQPQQASVAATLLTNPYGNDQLFSNLANPTPAVGPLATPLAGAQKPAKRPAALPQFKINPSASLRLITPQKRSNGYGFSYATYGTPGSAQGFTSNGLGSSLLQSGGLSRSLGKSFSTSNLAKSVGSGDSVLAPGAFTPNTRSYTGGSIRRLKIDRNLRTDLFGESAPEPPTKRVSFDEGDKGKTLTNGAPVEATPSNALVRTETDGPEPTSEELGLLRAARPMTNGIATNGDQPPEEVRNELAMVPEDGPAPPTQAKPISSRDLPRSQNDRTVGDYWMTPSMDDLRKMSREQLKRVSGFTVGRDGVGKIEFDPVDLSNIPLDDICDGIVRLAWRQANVYESGVNTPPMGKGLNVPSTITLENSWPRAQAGRLPVYERKGDRFDKHIERLRRVEDTEFISYDPETGVWVFRVQHFTTYGLDYDEEDDSVEYSEDIMSQDPTPKGNNTAVQEMSQASSEEGSIISYEDDSESNPDDTFDFKKGPSKILPGSFGAQPIPNDDEMADDNDDQEQDASSSYLEQQATSSHEDLYRSSGSSNAPPVEAVDEAMEDESEDGYVSEQEMASSLTRPAPTSYNNDFGVSFSGSLMPKSILKASTMLNGTPKKDLTLAGDWAEQLQRTASPKKQDRQALRERQSVMGVPPVDTAPPLAASIAGKAFSTTMDIMNSLWAPSTAPGVNALQTSTVGGKGFEV